MHICFSLINLQIYFKFKSHVFWLDNLVKTRLDNLVKTQFEELDC